jgi:hypothetical protein
MPKERIMKIATSILASVARQNITMRKTAVLMFLLVNIVSGCTVLQNSASFYENQPRRPINWREYTSD